MNGSESVFVSVANLKSVESENIERYNLNLKPSLGKKLRIDISLKLKSYPCLICFIRDS